MFLDYVTVKATCRKTIMYTKICSLRSIPFYTEEVVHWNNSSHTDETKWRAVKPNWNKLIWRKNNLIFGTLGLKNHATSFLRRNFSELFSWDSRNLCWFFFTFGLGLLIAFLPGFENHKLGQRSPRQKN